MNNEIKIFIDTITDAFKKLLISPFIRLAIIVAVLVVAACIGGWLLLRYFQKKIKGKMHKQPEV